MHDPVGLISPGQMGAAVGSAIAAGSRPVHWASEGRGDASCSRAEAAGLTDVGSFETLVESVGTIVSVCPPETAQALAGQVAALGFDGVYVDANATGPSTARAIQRDLEPKAHFVDGGIIGSPPRSRGSTRLYLAGEQAERVAALFQHGLFEVIVMDVAIPAASALKVAYATWTKGTAALLYAIWAFADAEGVAEVLHDEWDRSQPALIERLASLSGNMAPKAWRFVDEMRQAGESFDSVGLPSGFHQAAGEVFWRLRHLKDLEDVTAGQAIAHLLEAPD